MVPSRRIATLFDQARRHQQQSCLYHTDPEPFSLYVDHECHAGRLPSVTSHILDEHKDEVHTIVWSRDGSMLASGGSDGLVVIWQLQRNHGGDGEAVDGVAEGGYEYTMVLLHHLRDNSGEIGPMAWSPDGETLVTAADRTLGLWDTIVS